MGDHFGITREDVVAELEAHDADTFYLTTPYRSGNWSSPNGDTSYNGRAAMNCGGFVGYVVKKVGMDLDAFNRSVRNSPHYFWWIRYSSNSWYIYIKTYNVHAYRFSSKEELLSSGLARKGDIILTWYSYTSTKTRDNHVGFFYGDRPDEDLMWHSSPVDGENTIGPLTCLAPNSVWYLIPLSEPPEEDETTDPSGSPDDTLPDEETNDATAGDSTSGDQPPDTDADTDTETDIDTDTDADPDTDMDSDTGMDSDTDIDTGDDFNTDADVESDSQIDTGETVSEPDGSEPAVTENTGEDPAAIA